MELKFNSNLDYQQNAVNSVVGLFEGQKIMSSNFTICDILDNTLGVYDNMGIGNRLSKNVDILKNTRSVQRQNNLPQSIKLNDMNFTIEMETGTGKTYVYLKTIFELNKNYGFKKFVIVVPSVAIREGVYKTLEITKKHFGDEYNNEPCEYFIYDSSKLDKIRNFATSSNIQIMIINIDAFRKGFGEDEEKSNIIHRRIDSLNGQRPIDIIKETNPIVIIDE
ncbi:MAG: DEAD/DEAH box helicase family protein, partial [Peptostreptococcaceae bacterium]